MPSDLQADVVEQQANSTTLPPLPVLPPGLRGLYARGVCAIMHPMDRVLLIARDALFRAKIHYLLSRGGATVVCVADTSLADACLSGGSIGMVVAEVSRGSGVLEEWLRPVALRGDIKLIMAADELWEDLRQFASEAPGDRLCISKHHLEDLGLEIVREFLPGFARDGGSDGWRRIRRSPRLDKSLRVFIDDNEAGELKSRTLDINHSGARVITGAPLAPNSVLGARLLLPSFAEIVPVEARVVWSRPTLDGNKHLAGLFFERITDTDRFNLADYLNIDPAKR